MIARTRRVAFASVVGLFLARCSGGGNTMPDSSTTTPLTSEAPYLTQIAGSVRNITVTARAAQTQAMEAASCTAEADLFDAPVTQHLTAMASSGECVVYSASATLPLDQQQWICAGAINLDYNGGHQEHLALCPDLGPPSPSVTVDCGGLAAGATLHVTSGDELPPNDVVTDLDVSLMFPGAITFTQPTSVGITTWPTSGDLTVNWSSAGATAAMVMLQVHNPTGPTPLVICRPHTNGQVVVAGDLIFQANIRSQDVMVRVFSYKDATTTAEMGHTYHVWAGLESAVLLQGRL